MAQGNTVIGIQVGIDFGTSSTKICYKRIGQGFPVIPLRFEGGTEYNPSYCLPSLACFDKREQLIFGNEAARELTLRPYGEGFRRFKVVVAGQHEEQFRDPQLEKEFYEYASSHPLVFPETLSSLFLAYTMEVAIKTISRSPDFRNSHPNFTFNVCMPIDHIQSKARETFEKIVAAAEDLVKVWSEKLLNEEGLERALSIYEAAEYGRSMSDNPMERYCRKDESKQAFAIPEAVAETRAYQESLDMREGIHAVMDFGAGTTDVCIFNNRRMPQLHGERYNLEMQQHWYSAYNFPRGGAIVERIVADYVKERDGICRDSDVASMLRNALLEHQIQERMDVIFDKLFKLSYKAWQDAFSRYREQVRDGAQEAFSGLNVRIFLCGGAASLPGLESVFKESWMEGWGPYDVLPLRSPRDFRSENGKIPFSRMAVAYGLSSPIAEFQQFILPRDLPIREIPPPPPPRNWADYDNFPND